MHCLAAEMQTEHLALIISACTAVCTIGLGIMQFASRRKQNDATPQSPECRFEHERLDLSVGRIERQGEAILVTQRDITQALGRVANVLDRMEKRLEDQGT